MERWKGKTGKKVPRLFSLFLAILLGAFNAVSVQAFRGKPVLIHEPKVFMEIAMNVGAKTLRQFIAKKVWLIMRLVDWAVESDFYAVTEDHFVVSLRITCSVFFKAWRNDERFELMKQRVRDCRKKADDYRQQHQLNEFSETIYEVIEAQVEVFVRRVNAPSDLRIVETIDEQTDLNTNFFCFCQTPTAWDDKSSKCLGGVFMEYSPWLDKEYRMTEEPIEADSLEPTETRRGGRRVFRLMKALTPMQKQLSEAPNIILFDLVKKYDFAWHFHSNYRAAAGGGKILTITCSTDIKHERKQHTMKDMPGTSITFSGLDLKHVDMCLRRAPSKFRAKVTDAYIASSEFETLRAIEQSLDENFTGHKLILKRPETDQLWDAKADGALWESYREVKKWTWKVMKRYRGKTTFVKHCTGTPEIIIPFEQWSMVINSYVGDPLEGRVDPQGLLDTPARIYLGNKHRLLLNKAGTNWRESTHSAKKYISLVNKSKILLPTKLSKPESDDNFLICPREIGLSIMRNSVAEVRLFVDDSKSGIRSTNIFTKLID